MLKRDLEIELSRQEGNVETLQKLKESLYAQLAAAQAQLKDAEEADRLVTAVLYKVVCGLPYFVELNEYRDFTDAYRAKYGEEQGGWTR